MSARSTFPRRIVVLSVIDAWLLVLVIAGIVMRVADRPQTTPVVAYGTDAVGAFEIDAAYTTRVERVRDGWDIVRGSDRYPARSDRVEPFLKEITGAKLVRHVTSRVDLVGDLGLGADARTIVLETGAGRSVLHFGRAVPGGTYLRIGDQSDAWLTDAGVDFYLGQPSSFWAYLRLFPESVRGGDIVRLSASGAAGAVLLTRGADGGTWSMTTGSSTREVSADAVAGLLRQAADLVGRGFSDGQGWDAMPRSGTLSFDLADERSFSVAIRNAGDAEIARPNGPALPGAPYGGLFYAIDPSAMSRLFVDPESIGRSD